MDDAVGFRRPGTQALGILECAAVDPRSERLDRGSRRVGAREPDDLMTGADQLRDHGQPYEPRRSRDEHSHPTTSPVRRAHRTCRAWHEASARESIPARGACATGLLRGLYSMLLCTGT